MQHCHLKAKTIKYFDHFIDKSLKGGTKWTDNIFKLPVKRKIFCFLKPKSTKFTFPYKFSFVEDAPLDSNNLITSTCSPLAAWWRGWENNHKKMMEKFIKHHRKTVRDRNAYWNWYQERSQVGTQIFWRLINTHCITLRINWFQHYLYMFCVIGSV